MCPREQCSSGFDKHLCCLYPGSVTNQIISIVPTFVKSERGGNTPLMSHSKSLGFVPQILECGFLFLNVINGSCNGGVLFHPGGKLSKVYHLVSSVPLSPLLSFANEGLRFISRVQASSANGFQNLLLLLVAFFMWTKGQVF